MGRIKINLKRLNIESEYSKYIRPFNLDLILINLSFFLVLGAYDFLVVLVIILYFILIQSCT